MRIYHFVPGAYGLDDLRRRRLKVATIDDLNDPFDLRAFGVADAQERAVFEHVRAELAKSTGLLCFSKSWHNPVQWSHYAERHRGICMGFDVPDEMLSEVIYERRRINPGIEVLMGPDDQALELMSRGLVTKYAHWRYEQEVRHLVDLKDCDRDGDYYFVNFSERIALREIVVGANSQITRKQVLEVLGPASSDVALIKARLAFRTFRVVRQRRENLWR